MTWVLLHLLMVWTSRASAKHSKEIEQGATELDSTDATQCRSIAARVNYLSEDRPDLQFAAKELCRMMARPAMWLLGRAEEAGKVLGPLPVVDFAVQRHWKYPDRIVGLLGQRPGWMSPHPTVNVGWMRDMSGRGAQYSRRSFCLRSRTQCIRQVHR